MKRKRWYSSRKETPRQRLWRLVKQIDNIKDYSFGQYSLPCLCQFCQNYWFEQGLEDADSGCYANLDSRCDFMNWEVLHCRKFKPYKDWAFRMERALTEEYFRVFSEIKRDLEEFKDVKKAIQAKNREYKEAEDKYRSFFRRVYGAEVLERMTGKPWTNESTIL